MHGATPSLVDLWTSSPDYRQQFQSPDEIDTVITLLDLEHGTALVDAGCGNGAFARAAAERHPGCHVHAFDALASAIAACRSAGDPLPNLHIAQATAEALPLGSAGADRVLCRAVLHHLQNSALTYAEFARILKPGGLLLLQAPCNPWSPAVGQILTDVHLIMDDSHPRQYHHPGQILLDLTHAGFLSTATQCWRYTSHGLTKAQVDFLKRQRADETLRLTPTGGGAWSIELYWLRILATRL
jgi:ubiquinone/menaquinone biosynthesis C-methylase UbiE